MFASEYVSKLWVISSVGLEHYLDRVGVTGSNPVLLTIPNPPHILWGIFFAWTINYPKGDLKKI